MTDIIQYKGTAIDFTADRLNMTHMWKAAKGTEAQRPAEWLRLDGTKQFLSYLETMGPTHSLTDTKEGRNGGTWGHWKVAMAYAKYLSPEFHNWCLEVVREKFENKIPSPGTKDTTLAKLALLEDHANKLAARGRITEDQALDIVTVFWRDECGIDLTRIPTLEYKLLEVGIGAVSMPTTDVTLFPLSAYAAGEQCKDLIDEYRKLQKVVEKKRYKTGLKTYGMPFCDVLRDLRLHPHSTENGYIATDEVKEAAKEYCLEVPQAKNVTKHGVQTVKIIKVVQFNDKAVAKVSEELTQRINTLKEAVARAAQVAAPVN
jgi:hypothetical protein